MFVAEADEAKEACEDPLIKLCHMITVNRNIIGNDMILLPGGIQLHFKGKVHEADPSFIFVWASCQMFFFVDQNCLISVLNHLINHQNTQLNAETKIKLQIVIFLEFWVLFTFSSFVGHPIYCRLPISFFSRLLIYK